MGGWGAVPRRSSVLSSAVRAQFWSTHQHRCCRSLQTGRWPQLRCVRAILVNASAPLLPLLTDGEVASATLCARKFGQRISTAAAAPYRRGGGLSYAVCAQVR